MFFLIPKPIRRIISLVFLVGLLSAGDVWVRVWAEGKVEDRAEEAWDNAASVDVTFRGFPFVGRLLAFGRVEGMDVRLREVQQRALDFSTVGIDLAGIELDRGAFLTERKVRFEDLESGTVFAVISAEELSDATGAQIDLEPGRAIVTVAGRTVTGSVAVRDGRVVVSASGIDALSARIPSRSYFPCAADAVVLSGRVEIYCSVDQIPGPLIEAASDIGNELR